VWSVECRICIDARREMRCRRLCAESSGCDRDQTSLSGRIELEESLDSSIAGPRVGLVTTEIEL
jgi:hypothetical protein